MLNLKCRFGLDVEKLKISGKNILGAVRLESFMESLLLDNSGKFYVGCDQIKKKSAHTVYVIIY